LNLKFVHLDSLNLQKKKKKKELSVARKLFKIGLRLILSLKSC